MTHEELKEWETWYIHYKNGYHMSKNDWVEFMRLNHVVLEATHEIHNHNMMEKDENVAGKPDAFKRLFNSLPERDKVRM